MTNDGQPYISSNPHVSALTTEILAPYLAQAVDELLLLTGGPADLRCLLYVAKALGHAFAGGVRWTRNELFSPWRRLAELVNTNASLLEQKYPHLKPPPRVKHYQDGNTELLNPMFGYIDKHPLWAMLCATHENKTDPNLRIKYACLQIQILLARRREARHKAKEQRRTIAEILNPAGGDRRMRVAIELGKAVRAVSTDKFVALLEALQPLKSPPLFRSHLRDWKASPAGDAGVIFGSIFQHVVKERDARHNNPGKAAPRKTKRRPSHPEHIEYSGDRIGLAIEDNGEDGFGSEATFQLTIPAGPEDPETDTETRNKEQHNFKSPVDAARRLGVHPTELGSQSGIHSKVPEAKSPGHAKHIARSRGRSMEINRSLMPWSSDRLSIRQFQRTILPTLESILGNPGVSSSDLKSAMLVALSIDSGRQMKDVVTLAVEPKLQTALLAISHRARKEAVGFGSGMRLVRSTKALLKCRRVCRWIAHRFCAIPLPGL